MIKQFWQDLDFCFPAFQKELFQLLASHGHHEYEDENMGFHFEGFAEAIADHPIIDKCISAPCRVVDVNLDTFEVAIRSNHPDDKDFKLWLSFPYDFISRLSFENPHLQKYTEIHIELIKNIWTLGAQCHNPESAYALAMCEMLKGTDADIPKALELCLQAAESDYEYAQRSLLCICVDASDHDIDIDESTFKKAIEYSESWYQAGALDNGYYLGFYYLRMHDYATAMRYFTEIIDKEALAPVYKSSIAKHLAPFYKDGLRDKYGSIIVHRNYHTAKKYYELANHNGELSADLEYINRQLGINSSQNQMQLFAERVLSTDPSLTGREMHEYVVSDLTDEFGDSWLQLPENSRKDLISGCQVYVMLYSLGEDLFKNLDFSSAIIPIIKACEIVFRRYISSGFYDYLIESGIEASALPSKHPFVEYDKFSRSIVFKNKEKIEFTMGAIKWVIDLQNGAAGMKTVNRYFLDYACMLFGAAKDNRLMRNQIETYFTRLAAQMNQFTFNIRNPAAHSDIMPIWQAEICGNEIIKVRKVLKDFMDHIQPNAL